MNEWKTRARHRIYAMERQLRLVQGVPLHPGAHHKSHSGNVSQHENSGYRLANAVKPYYDIDAMSHLLIETLEALDDPE